MTNVHTVALKLKAFTDESIAWCNRESESATMRLVDVLNEILAEAERIASMSQTSLQSLRSFAESAKERKSTLTTAELMDILKGLSKQDQKVQKYIFPIIQTVQFQDRIRQNMENLQQILQVWIDFRQSPEAISPDALQQFGEMILKKTTMVEERDAIRRAIPGLPEDEAPDGIAILL